MNSKNNLAFCISIVGQIIAGCGQPFVQFTPSKVAEHWFPESQRVLATTIISMGTPMGMAIGSALPPYFVTHQSENIPFVVSLYCFDPVTERNMLLIDL